MYLGKKRKSLIKERTKKYCRYIGPVRKKKEAGPEYN